MIKRSIYIGNPAWLRCSKEQMEIVDVDTKAIKAKVPIEDLAILVLDHPQITISNYLLQMLMKNKIVLISCDDKHLPLGIMQALYGHSEYSERIKLQISISEALKKNLWKQIVEQKIANQTQMLIKWNCYYEPMLEYEKEVKSGDSTNREGVAAQHYWRYLVGNDFLRERNGDAPNCFFDYGYAILRSIVARAIVETGLLPVLGLFHKNKYNPYCLADDVMEPFRPMVDDLVMQWVTEHPEQEDLTTESKAHLIKMATMDVKIDEMTRPLMVAVKSYVSGLYQCYTGEKRLLKQVKLL